MKEKEVLIKTLRRKFKNKKILYGKLTVKRRIIEIIGHYYDDYPHENTEV